MKTTINLVLSIVVAFWIMAIAIISVQNATPVSLRFITFESIQIPVGLLLAFCIGVGLIGTNVFYYALGISNFQPSKSRGYEDDAEFFVDEDY